MRFAVKVLTKSDLTFFEPQFRLHNASRQKSINLNRDVFVDELYPDLPEILAAGHGELEVRLRIEGPGISHDQIRVVRKITKRGSKNYRLNGEFVRNPDGEGGRFNALAEGDVALLAFDGAAQPSLIRLFVLSAADPDDAVVALALRPVTGRAMSAISQDDLAAAIALAPPEHPLRDLLLDPVDAADLEQAAQGDPVATQRLLNRPGRRRVSIEQLAEAQRRAAETGREGEQLISDHFERGGPEVISWKWCSVENAINPWDFDLTTPTGGVRVEVKATRGTHGTGFHISMAELEAATEAVRYDIYRVSGLGEDGGALRIATSVGDFARNLVDILQALPPGVRPDGFTVDPALLTWSEVSHLSWLDIDEA